MEALRLDQNTAAAKLPRRENTAHKGVFGRLLLLCGSVGYTGAAELTSKAACRGGAGLVFLGVPQSIYPIMAGKLTEPIVFPLPDREGGLSPEALPEILRRLEKTDVCVLGPGLGLREETQVLVRRVLEECPCPLILDADGITAVKAHKHILRERRAATVLTPHEGELRRLGYEPGAGRQEAALQAAGELKAVVLLKGHRTLITDGTRLYENTTGNPGMATGGSGDVLAGLLGALLGQGMEPLEASACAAWFHGAAGDLCAGELGQYAMLPSDMIRALSRLLP